MAPARFLGVSLSTESAEHRLGGSTRDRNYSYCDNTVKLRSWGVRDVAARSLSPPVAPTAFPRSSRDRSKKTMY